MKTVKSSKINDHIFNNELLEYVKFEADVALLMTRSIKSEANLNQFNLQSGTKIKNKNTVLSQTVCGAPNQPNGLFQ